MNDSPSDRAAGRTAHACPFVNRNDVRCASRFSLGRIEQAFAVCFGSYHACPMYHRINGEQRDAIGAANRLSAATGCLPPRLAAPFPPHTITITANGRALSLRPTGT